MSILHSTNNAWIISHQLYFGKIPLKAGSADSEDPEDSSTSGTGSSPGPTNLRLNPDLFEINHPYKSEKIGKIKKKKRKAKEEEMPEKVKVAKKVEEFLTQLKADPEFSKVFKKKEDTVTGDLEDKDDNKLARKVEADLYEQFTSLEKWPEFYGENNEMVGILSHVNGLGGQQRFLFPPQCKFHCKDVGRIRQELIDQKFRMIVIDPPWRNKFVKRRKRHQLEAGYKSLETDDFTEIPIKELLDEKGLIAVWITNCKRHQEELISKIFPLWGVSHLCTWYWLKVTKSGEPICSFKSDTSKQPFETIMLGTRSLNLYDENHRKTRLIISIPSSIHSHKPPLSQILRQFIPSDLCPQNSPDDQLEIFARTLTPGFTSYGNEVVKLQHESLFIK